MLTLTAAVLLAAPASADVPEGWSNPDPVSGITVLWMLVGVPIGLILLIALFTYAPAMIRGEKLTPGPARTDDEWFGGPRKGTSELAGPDDEQSKAGAASGRW